MSKKLLQLCVALLAIALLISCLRSPNGAKVSQGDSAVTQAASASGSVQGRANGANAASNQAGGQGAVGVVAFAQLPEQAQKVIGMIQGRATFEHRQDGQVFGNREGVLPKQPRGYYQEFTVPTPGASNRGARRVVSGQGRTGDAATSGEYYYTADHYRTFARVRMD